MAAVLPMDGYHIPRAQLEEMGNLGKNWNEEIYDTIGIDGVVPETKEGAKSYNDLMARRGAPWTFDHKLLLQDFTQAKKTGMASLPIYSRAISDPVPDGVSFTPSTKILLCEGNYLCASNHFHWEPLQKIWDATWYVYAPDDIVLDRLINRHLQNWTGQKRALWGEGREGAEKKVLASDFKNAKWIEKNSKNYVDLVIDHY
eukprot:9471377-Ditylum_brightwellii.AAC.1